MIQKLKKILLFSLIILILAPTGMSYAKTSMLEEKDVAVIYEEGLQGVAKQTAELYSAIRTDLERTIGWKIDFKPGIILIKENDTFQKMAGNSLIVAYALPDKGVIVIDYSRMKTDPFTLDATLKHEVCHLLLHKYIGDDSLPKWLDEGVAQWTSGGLADIVIEKRSILNEAFLQNRLVGLKYLSEGFPDNDNLLMLAYAESKDFTEYLVAKNGSQGLLALLNHLKDGDDIDSAIIKTYSISFDELETSWHEKLEKKATWISALINNLYDILFFLSALILVFAFIKAWRRKKKYEEEDN